MDHAAEDQTRWVGLAVATVVGWGVLSVVVHSAALPFLLGPVGASVGQVVGRGVLWALLGVGVSGALVPPMRWLFRDPTPTWSRLLGLLALCLAGGLLFSVIFYSTQWPLPEFQGRGRGSWSRAVAPTLSLLVMGSLLLVAWNVQRLQQARERMLKAEALAVEARLAMLRYELDPHFLFNTLNSVIGTIDESPARAQQMVRQLAELLRHTLKGSERLVPLTEELRTIALYLAIEQVRFEDQLQVEVTVAPEAEGCPIPPLLLQPLVENAIKHGMTGDGPLRLRILAEGVDGALQITVTNNGRLTRGTGIGLRNLEDRLSHLYDGQASFGLTQEGDDVVARLVLPEVA